MLVLGHKRVYAIYVQLQAQSACQKEVEMPRLIVLFLVLLLCVTGLASGVPAIRAEEVPYQVSLPLVSNNRAFALLDSPPPIYRILPPIFVTGDLPDGTAFSFTVMNTRAGDVAVNPRCHIVTSRYGCRDGSAEGRRVETFYLTADGSPSSPRERLEPLEERTYTYQTGCRTEVYCISCIGVAAEEPAPTVPAPTNTP